MSSPLYFVSVDDVLDAAVEMTVTIIHPDVYAFPESKTFALQILCDPTNHWELDNRPGVAGCPIDEAIDLDEILDEEWVCAHAAGFVASVEILETENYPIPTPWEEREAYEAFWDSDDRATATYRITATHSGWTQHLEAGMSWDTTSWDMGPADEWERPDRYPGDRVLKPADSPEAGFEPCERTDLNGRYFDDYDLESGFLVPMHGDSYYVARDKIEGSDVTDDVFEDFFLKPVVVEGGYAGEIVGTLISIDEEYRLLQIFKSYAGGCGTRGISFDAVESIGRAWYLERVWADEG